MANRFLMNEVRLFLSYFLHFDLLSLGFTEQELSEKVRRILVIYILRIRELKAHMCVHAHVYLCIFIYVHIMYPVYTCVCLCTPVSMGLCTLHVHCSILHPQMSLKALMVLSRYNNNT